MCLCRLCYSILTASVNPESYTENYEVTSGQVRYLSVLRIRIANDPIRHGILPSIYQGFSCAPMEGVQTKCSLYNWTNFPGYGYVTSNFPVIEHTGERRTANGERPRTD